MFGIYFGLEEAPENYSQIAKDFDYEQILKFYRGSTSRKHAMTWIEEGFVKETSLASDDPVLSSINAEHERDLEARVEGEDPSSQEQGEGKEKKNKLQEASKNHVL